MEFNEQVKSFVSQCEAKIGGIKTEEATKMSLIVPFFQMLGYDVFNPNEFCPEYTADVGIKKGEKVDYAILTDDTPVILIECKSCTDNLDKQASQLFRYFGTSSAKFGILTNGINYKFYTDLEETNKMDLVPFLDIDIQNLKDSQIVELKRFCKSEFDRDKILSTAEESKYSGLIKEVIMKEIDNPSDDFVRLILSNVYEGQKNQKVLNKFQPVVKKTFSSLISEIVSQKITSALNASEEKADKEVEEVAESKIVTTQEEMDGFYIVRGILAGICDIEDVIHRDKESYFGILYKDNNRKPICRLYLDMKVKKISIPDADKNFTFYTIDSLNDIYRYKDLLISAVKNYL